MELSEDLRSGSSPKITKAAEKIIKKELKEYCADLVSALTQEIEKPKAWKSQSKLIKAIGRTACKDALPYLRKLADKDHKNKILYRELGMSIALLDDISAENLSALYSTFSTDNEILISGACAAILYKEIIPNSADIKKITDGVAPYTTNEGPVVTPRFYIAAVAYLWQPSETKEFLHSCQQSDSTMLVEIANEAIRGKKYSVNLV